MSWLTRSATARFLIGQESRAMPTGARCKTWVCLSRGLVTLLALLVVAASTADAQPPAIYLGYVTRVVDGDTIYAAIGSQIESVRYIGVNAPELEHRTRGEAPGGV